MDFRVLGTLEVIREGRPLDLSGQKRRALTHEQRDGIGADARAERSHCPVATVRDAATRRTLIDDEVDELLAHTATTESPAAASAG